jgi:L-asparaginase
MGGTIAGVACDPQKPKEYKAGALGVAYLIDRLGLSNHLQTDVQNVAQINSKDMQVPHWQALLSAVQTANQDPQTRAVVITHGTDTLEETACLLEVMGPWLKPVVLTCAMLPANAPDADGPGNLKDALNIPLCTLIRAKIKIGMQTISTKLRTDKNAIAQPKAETHATSLALNAVVSRAAK